MAACTNMSPKLPGQRPFRRRPPCSCGSLRQRSRSSPTSTRSTTNRWCDRRCARPRGPSPGWSASTSRKPLSKRSTPSMRSSLRWRQHRQRPALCRQVGVGDMEALAAVLVIVALTASVWVGWTRRGRIDDRTPPERPPGRLGVAAPAGVQLRYQRVQGAGWVPISVSAAQLRERGLDAWPAAVGVWWPRVGGAGMVVCRPCIEVHPTAAITDRLPHEVALVLVGTRARHAVERQCAAHSGRPDPTAARQSPPSSYRR